MTNQFPLHVFFSIIYCFVSSEDHVSRAVKFLDWYSGSAQYGLILFKSSVILNQISRDFSQANAGVCQVYNLLTTRHGKVGSTAASY
jgi:hypothetical protein